MTAAPRPSPRLITVKGTGEFAEWTLTARADFPARYVQELQSRDLARMLPVLDLIIVSHNMPDETGEVAQRMADVDPYRGLIELLQLFTKELGKVPNAYGASSTGLPAESGPPSQTDSGSI